VGEIQLPGALNGAAWSQVITNLDSNHRDLVRGWFSGLIPERLDRGILDVRAASSEQVSYLDQWCGPIFADAIREITGHLVSINFHCNGNGHHTNVRKDVAPQPIPLTFEIEAVRLNPEYTFESFVTGPSNQLAHAACIAVSDAPGRSYNPLFIHGDVGLGKSHLLQAVCHAIHHGHQPAEILYLTGENFANHFIEAVERGALHNFRNRYRHVDVLVVQHALSGTKTDHLGVRRAAQ
jgi:chromosomal replication initiator protein